MEGEVDLRESTFFVVVFAQALPPILSGYIAASLTSEAPIVVSSSVLILAGFFFMFMYHTKRIASQTPTR